MNSRWTKNQQAFAIGTTVFLSLSACNLTPVIDVLITRDPSNCADLTLLCPEDTCCNEELAECVDCCSDIDCDGGRCNTTLGACVECITDDDCSPERHCRSVERICAECADDSHCDDGDACTIDRCLFAGCAEPLKRSCNTGERCDTKAGCQKTLEDPVQTVELTGGHTGRVAAIWSRTQLTYRLEGLDASDLLPIAQTLREIYDEAAALWAEPVGALRLDRAPSLSADIIVYFCPADRDEPSCALLQAYDGWAQDPSFDRQLIQLVRLPDDLNDPLTRDLFKGLVVHEFGHNLGLLDDKDNPDAAMFPFGRTGRRPSADEISLLSQIYISPSTGIIEIVPTLPDIPTDPDSAPTLMPEGPDSDGDGLSDAFELRRSQTNPNLPDTDGDGLEDGFEVQFGLDPNNPDSDADGRRDGEEVQAGASARAPLICELLESQTGSRTAYFSTDVLEDASLTIGDTIRMTNANTSCTADDITVAISSDSTCSLRMPRQLREDLCIFRPTVAVPIRYCQSDVRVDALFDFADVLDPTPSPELGEWSREIRNETATVRFDWEIPTSDDFTDPFIVLTLDEGISIKPCDRLIAVVEVSSDAEIRFEAKEFVPGSNASITHFDKQICVPTGEPRTIDIDLTERFPLHEVGFAIERDALEDTQTSGVLWVHSVELIRGAVAPVTSPQPPFEPCPLAVPFIVWADSSNGTIDALSLDGADFKNVFSREQGSGRPRWIAVDSAAGEIYWTDNDLDVIRKAHIDGSNVVDVRSDLNDPAGIALDLLNRDIYWIDTFREEIHRQSMDASSDHDVRPIGAISSRPVAIALIPEENALFWTDPGRGSIYRSGLNGTNPVCIWPPNNEPGSPEGIALDIANRLIYWTDSANNEIRRMPLDGGPHTVVFDGVLDAVGIAVDPINDRLFWVDDASGLVVQADMHDETISTKTLQVGVADPIGIAYVETLAGCSGQSEVP